MGHCGVQDPRWGGGGGHEASVPGQRAAQVRGSTFSDYDLEGKITSLCPCLGQAQLLRQGQTQGEKPF